jgi:hypothetical protein
MLQDCCVLDTTSLIWDQYNFLMSHCVIRVVVNGVRRRAIWHRGSNTFRGWMCARDLGSERTVVPLAYIHSSGDAEGRCQQNVTNRGGSDTKSTLLNVSKHKNLHNVRVRKCSSSLTLQNLVWNVWILSRLGCKYFSGSSCMLRRSSLVHFVAGYSRDQNCI